MMLLMNTALLWLLIRTTSSAPFSVTVAVIADGGEGYANLSFSYVKSLPAVQLAQETLAITFRDQIDFNFIYNVTMCSGDGTGALAAALHCKHDVGVFIGPGCINALKIVSQLTKSWNIPLVTPVGLSTTDKVQYPLVTTLSPFTTTNNVNGLDAVLKFFQWTSVAVIYDEDFTVSLLLKDEFMLRFVENIPSNKAFPIPIKANSFTDEILNQIWFSGTQKARIFIIYCKLPEIKALMLSAYRLGLATSGDYVYFLQENLSRYPSPKFGASDSNEDKNFLKSLGHAFWSYVDAAKSENVNFTAEVVRRSLQDYGYDYKGSEVSQYIPCYYDAVILFANVLNKTLHEGGDPTNGTAMTHKMWNQTFEGIHAPVTINANGFRESNLTFAYYNLSTGVLTPALVWHHKTDTVDVTATLTWPYNDGIKPLGAPECGFYNEKCSDKVLSGVLAGAIGGMLGFVTLTGVLVAACLFRAWKKQYERNLWWWRIHSTELSSTNWSTNSSIHIRASLKSLAGSQITDLGLNTENKFAVWKGQIVRLRKLQLKYLHFSRSFLTEFKMIRELNHTNIIQVHGACIEENLKLLVTEPCVKGSLEDLLGNGDVVLDTNFKFSLCHDVIHGLCYLHESPIRCHGRLSSEVCLIDNRFSVKLSDYGLPSLYSGRLVDVTSQEYKHECLWKAPEVLRGEATGTKEADVYSFGIILQEVLTKDAPYSVESAYMSTDEIIQKIVSGCDPPFRPAIELPSTMRAMKTLIENCWAEDPKQRPTSSFVKMAVKKIAISMGETGHLLDNLMKRMEMYATNLEKMVEEKTQELQEEKKRSEELLYQILPRSVADCLKAGQRVEPQAYECVTIYFSDIVGFTVLSGKSSPLEVVDLLNDLYSCFDSTIESYDVYKVETIGDAYMVVSGLPQRNGNLHVVNIAKMAINVLENIREFKIRHMPDERLQIRIGLHSGPVCSGVVGLKMPRYCLFGDTVNVASRMESYGKAMMIHISPSCKAMLDQFGTFHTIPRGPITIKGKGEMLTYWLVSCDSMETTLQLVNSEED